MQPEPLPSSVLLACEALRQEPATVSQVAARLGLTERGLRQAFRRHLGVTPKAFQQSARLNRAKEKLRGGANTLDALFDAGYGSVRGLYETGPDRLGMTPATFARKGKGLRLAVESAPHSLGLLLVAGTERGVSFVGLGDSKEALERELRQDFPLAHIEAAPSGRWIHSVLRALDNSADADAIPLDVFATAFQARVWQALRCIPAGETRSYAELAASLGNPNATRAVARACATNTAAILIPCHRIVGSNGSLTGYRWGVERKAALLRREAAESR